MKITRADIRRAMRRHVWILGNQVLYDLCRTFPQHTSDDVILAKILIIGRVYAVAIERRRIVKIRGDDFYTKTVAPHVRKSGIDTWLAALPSQPALDEEATARVLETHGKVTALFSEISDLNKRSLASKYLHFHRPDLFFIYDTRAMSAIRAVTPTLGQPSETGQDQAYASFFRRCVWLTQAMREKFDTDLTPRQLDDLLISLWERLPA